jgi:chromate transporter
MLAGTLGGLLATWVTFTPCFLWIFLGAPFIERLRGNKALAGALSAITAAVVGVILNLAIWFGIHTLFREVRHVEGFGLSFDAPVPASVDPWALLLAAAMIARLRFKVGMISTLAACSAARAALYLVGAVSEVEGTSRPRALLRGLDVRQPGTTPQARGLDG